jgi:hypothetical protein
VPSARIGGVMYVTAAVGANTQILLPTVMPWKFASKSS